MPIFGTDTSRYQQRGTYDPGAFEIINGEEPDGYGGGDFTATLLANVAEGRPQGVYLWVHPNRRVDVIGIVNRVRGVLGGDPELGYWLDYEESGVEQWQVDQAYVDADAIGARMGLYTYLNILPTVDLRGRDLWLAYYPGNNDGTYQSHYSDRARAEGAVLHQFTSSANAAVGLDRNVVLDDAWYGALVDGVLPSGPASLGDDMPYFQATSDSVSNPDVTTGSVWHDSATRMVRIDNPIAGVPVQPLDGELIGQMSVEKAKHLAQASGAVSGTFSLSGQGVIG